MENNADVEIRKNMLVHMAFQHVRADDNEPCKGCWFKDNPFFECKKLQTKMVLPRNCGMYDEDEEEFYHLVFKPVKLTGKKYSS